MAEVNFSSTNLIVNYLPQTMTDEQFHQMFAKVGQLNSSKIVRDRATGYSYGFGFVDYCVESDAHRAIMELNGKEMQNKRMKVAFSREGSSVKGTNLYLSNLPPNCSEERIKELFKDHGTIVQCRILYDQGSGNAKGVGFVLYSTKDEAQKAMSALDGSLLLGGPLPLSVKFAEENRGKARAPPIPVIQTRVGYGSMGGNMMGGGRGPPHGMHGGGPMQPMHQSGPMRNQGGNRGNRYNPMQGGNSGGMPQFPSVEDGSVLFVYNIGPQADERDLWQMFTPFGGVIKVNVIRDYGKNQSKGYGFVTMQDLQGAMAAIQGLNGYNYFGKPIQVSLKKQ